MRQRIFQRLVPFFVVLLCFENLFPLPGLPPKIQIAECVFVWLLATYPYQYLLTKKLAKHERYFLWAMAAYLFVHLTAAIVNGFRLSAFEVVGKLYLCCIAIVLYTFLDQSRSIATEKKILISIYWMGLLAAITSIIGFLLAVAGYPNHFVFPIDHYPYFGFVYRLTGPTHAPTMLATFLYMGLVVALSAGHLIQLSKVFQRVAITLMFLCAVLTYSKSILWLMLTTIIIMLVRKDRLTKVSMWLLTAATSLVFLVSTHYLFMPSNQQSHQQFITTQFTADQTVATIHDYDIVETIYVTLKRIGWETFTQHPIVGIGTGNFVAVVEAKKKAGLYPKQMFPYKPHCTLLEALAETGVLGGIALVFLWLVVCKHAWNMQRWQQDQLYAAIGLMLLFFLLESMATDIMNFRHVWVLFALSISYYNKRLAAIA